MKKCIDCGKYTEDYKIYRNPRNEKSLYKCKKCVPVNNEGSEITKKEY